MTTRTSSCAGDDDDGGLCVRSISPIVTGPVNGLPAGELADVRWQKSRYSNPSGNCVELAELPGGAGIALRNSRYPDGPALIYTLPEIAAFIAGARAGDFDNLLAGPRN